MWPAKNRGAKTAANCDTPSDLTDGRMGACRPLIAPAKRGGNRRHVGRARK